MTTTESAIGPTIATKSGAPLSRRERKAIETRTSILEAARRLFDLNGFEQTTIERIAEEADVAPRTFFRYFPNKEALLFAEFDAARDAMIQALKERPHDEDVLESIAVVLHHFSIEIDERWDEFAWAREVTGIRNLANSHERILANQQLTVEVAELIAERLGVEVELDPRPTVWSKSILATFVQAIVLGPHASPTGHTFDLCIDVLHSTAEALGRIEQAARAIQLHGDHD